mmetsp:Transcript_10293/g.26403  ORF Transcript_10293/g.26403 Transcript_10293/m.26403 type:complete len:911 (-) Transcript_10293:225-2957(-)|eukprot:jgi/Tetstr1/434636/TSEL_023727.t1
MTAATAARALRPGVTPPARSLLARSAGRRILLSRPVHHLPAHGSRAVSRTVVSAQESRTATPGKPLPDRNARLAALRPHAGNSKTAQLLNSFEETGMAHVHIGAGRLGLGLVIPALEATGQPYVILQRPSKAWDKLIKSNSDFVELKVNGKTCKPMKLVTDTVLVEDNWDVEEAFGCSLEGCGHLVLSNDTQTWDFLLQNASSFSCSLGSGVASWLGPKLSMLPEKELEQRPVLYACENDSAAVKDLQAQLEGKVEVVPCMVDRICAGREITGDPNPSIIVEAEDHGGSIVLLEPPQSPFAQVPLGGEEVVVPESAAMGAYLYKRKLVMVNGMHTTLAFLTLVYNEMQRSMGSPDEVAGFACEDLMLMTQSTAPEEVANDIWAWAVAQILSIMWENEERFMQTAHGVENNQELVENFLEIAKLNQKRFASLDDTTARVLGGGVSNRYMGRLVPIQECMHAVQSMASDWKENDSMKLLLEAAGLEIDDVVTACDKLVGRAWRYCRRDEVLSALEASGEVLSLGGGIVLEATRENLKSLAIKLKDEEAQGPVSLLSEKVAVLFDFDGTLADTEVTAMEVSYWQLAPYKPGVEAKGKGAYALTPEARDKWIEENAGQAFELLLAKMDLERNAAGMSSVAEARAAQEEDPAVLKKVDRYRQRLGLRTFADMRNPEVFCTELGIVDQHKEDAILALSKMSQANDHVKDTLENLSYLGIPFAIASTNGKPRVPLALMAAGLADWFGPEKIHSGESDFDEPKFKPEPDVYLLAAASEGCSPANCIAVEDSTSGIGSAANAGIGFIVGYVGSSHIAEDMEENHAYTLLSGVRSESGIGADIVISDMDNLVPLVAHWRGLLGSAKRPYSFPDALIAQMNNSGRVWLPEDFKEAIESGEVTNADLEISQDRQREESKPSA